MWNQRRAPLNSIFSSVIEHLCLQGNRPLTSEDVQPLLWRAESAAQTQRGQSVWTSPLSVCLSVSLSSCRHFYFLSLSHLQFNIPYPLYSVSQRGNNGPLCVFLLTTAPLSQQEEGELIVEGLLNIFWGLRRPIRLQMQDDHERIRPPPSSTSWHSGCNLDSQG